MTLALSVPPPPPALAPQWVPGASLPSPATLGCSCSEENNKLSHGGEAGAVFLGTRTVCNQEGCRALANPAVRRVGDKFPGAKSIITITLSHNPNREAQASICVLQKTLETALHAPQVAFPSLGGEPEKMHVFNAGYDAFSHSGRRKTRPEELGN